MFDRSCTITYRSPEARVCPLEAFDVKGSCHHGSKLGLRTMLHSSPALISACISVF